MYGNYGSRPDNNSSGFGKKRSEDEMSSIALQEAIRWTDTLMDLEFRGRGDKEYMIRHRLSENSGVPETYLYRLQYKARGMKDVAGEYYRRLKIYYEHACENNEAAADRYRDERLGIRGNNETANKEPAPAPLGMASSETQSKKA